MFVYIVALLALWFVYRWFKELKRVANKGDKHVYITGCDSGFGHLLATHLDKLGFCVIAGCYTEKGEDELKKASSDRLTTLHVDVTDSASVAQAAALIDAVVGQKGKVSSGHIIRYTRGAGSQYKMVAFIKMIRADFGLG